MFLLFGMVFSTVSFTNSARTIIPTDGDHHHGCRHHHYYLQHKYLTPLLPSFHCYTISAIITIFSGFAFKISAINSHLRYFQYLFLFPIVFQFNFMARLKLITKGYPVHRNIDWDSILLWDLEWTQRFCTPSLMLTFCAVCEDWIPRCKSPASDSWVQGRVTSLSPSQLAVTVIKLVFYTTNLEWTTDFTTNCITMNTFLGQSITESRTCNICGSTEIRHIHTRQV